MFIWLHQSNYYNDPLNSSKRATSIRGNYDPLSHNIKSL